MRRTHRAARTRAAATLLALAAAAGCRERPPPRNVLLVSIDSLRADRVGCYGNARPTSPTLDRLAHEGVRFEHALAPTSWTLPSHVSLLTGRSQRSHQTILLFDRIDPAEMLLAETFARHGYETVGIYSGPFLQPTYGFGRGFHAYLDCESSETAHLAGLQAWNSSHHDRTNACIQETFRGWLGRRSRRPFFAFVHMWDVHYDYIPPEPFASMFDPGYAGTLDGRDILGAGFPLDAPSRDVAHLLALYDGELRYTDETLGRLLEQLDRARVLDDTLVVVTADHGEQFLEHGRKGHRGTLFEEEIRVPLIFWARSGIPRGRVVADPVSLVDVGPTILDLLHLPPLAKADGSSVAPLLRTNRVTGSRPPVVSELYDPKTGELKLVSVREGERKLILQPGNARPRSYDLTLDPGEQRPGWARDDVLVTRIRREATLSGEAVRRRAVPPPPPAQLVEKLRGLGYVR